MIALRIGLGIFSLVLGSTVAQGAPNVLEARFVMIVGSAVQETIRVPLVPNDVCYEWQLRLDVPDGLLKFTEVFELPAPPVIWAGEDDPYASNKVSPDRVTSTTSEFFPVKDGWLHHGWCVADGDPLGAYSMAVSVDGDLLHTFHFDVVAVEEFGR